MAASTYQVIALAIYFVAMIAIGLWANSKNNSLDDYVLGGRQLSPTVAALSAGASDMSGWLLMGLPGAVYLSGLSQAWLAVGLTIGAWCNWKFVAPRLRSYTEVAGDAVTVPVFLSNRLKDTKRVLRIVSGVVILVFFTFYVSSGMVSGGLFFKSSFGQEYHTGMLLLAGITVFYTLFGGFMGASYTDMVQGLLMLAALIAVPVITIIDLGGVGPVVESISQVRPDALSIFAGTTFAGIVSSLAWGLGYFGQPHILVRFMAAESLHTIPNARRIGMVWMFLCLFGSIGVGYFGIAYFGSHPEIPNTVAANNETVFVEISRLLFNPWIAGLLLAAILAAVMSTLSCQLLVCSSALTQDLYKTFLRRGASDHELVWVGRAMVLLVSVVAIWLASDPNSEVLGLVSYAWAGFGAAFGPVVLLSLMWPRMTRNGALAGMIVGALTVIIWKKTSWAALGMPVLDTVYEIIPGFLLSTLAVVVFSLISPPPSASIRQTFDEVEADVREHG